jgi:hypothetical protein
VLDTTDPEVVKWTGATREHEIKNINEVSDDGGEPGAGGARGADEEG